MKLRLERRSFVLTVLLLIILAAELCLFIFFREAVREQIILPLAWLIFMVLEALRAVDQFIYWILLVMIGLLLLYTFAGQVLRPPADPVRKYTGSSSASRFRTWRRYLVSFEKSNFAGENLAFEISRLIASVYAHHEELSPAAVIRLVEEGNLTLPDYIRELLHTRRFSVEPAQHSWADDLLARTQARFKPPATPNPAQTEVEKIVAFIEQELEVSYDPDVNP